ncbi:MAG: hypothetical protein ACLT98_09885 [Eggerthellaceae bacterium]
MRNELEPSLLTFETPQKQRGTQRSIDISNARVQGLQDVMSAAVRPAITLKFEKENLVKVRFRRGVQATSPTRNVP